MKVVVGTRGSKLALTQTNWVIDELKKNNPEVDYLVINDCSKDNTKEVLNNINANYLAFKLADLNIEREFYMVTNKNITLSPTATKFREFVLNQFNG